MQALDESELNAVDFAAYVAFNTLAYQAKQQGVQLKPVMGMVRLKDVELMQRFKDVCKEVITSLVNQ